MAKAVDTTETTTKLHTHLGMTTRASGIPALCSTNTPVQRKKHVTSRSVGETNVFFLPVSEQRKTPEELIAMVLADADLLEDFVFAASEYGYSRELVLAKLGQRKAKTESLSDVRARRLAAQAAAADDAAGDEAAEG